jgi:Uma2 family endonuclease
MPLAPPHERDLCAELEALPENPVGEIIAGELDAQPRPTAPRAVACSSLLTDIHMPFHRGRVRPGDWSILVEPAVHFVRDTEVVVPDIVGWRRERVPRTPEDQRFEVAPDWVGEILSPTNARKGRMIKMPATRASASPVSEWSTPSRGP